MILVKIKKQKVQKNVSLKKLKFKNYKNCLELTVYNKKTDIDSIKENRKEIIKKI